MDDFPARQVDWAAGQELTGCSDMQTAFVKAILQGASQTRAAIQAGYRGEGAGLRGAASRIAKGNRVRALIAWAKAGGAGPPSEPGDLRELKKILWRHARGTDAARSIAATQALHKIEADERDAGMTQAADGMSEDRLGRDLLMTNRDGAASYALLLCGQGLALSRLPLFWDMHQYIMATYPELWERLEARQSKVMLEDLRARLADPSWQLWARQKVWGERGWIVDPLDNKAKPDPQGRPYIAPTARQTTYADAAMTAPDAGAKRPAEASGNGAAVSRSPEALVVQSPS